MLTQIDILKKYGIAVKGHVGQHLLIDPNIQRKTVELLDLKSTDDVLEIGPGLGALTGHIAGRCRSYTLVEMDPKFAEILPLEIPELASKGHKIIRGDILKCDLRETLKPKKGQTFKVISNLPYYITAPIIFHLFESRELFSRYVFTLQKEVSARLTASPGSKDYGRLTLSVRYGGDVKHMFDIPKTCFTPQPAVASSVIVIEPHPEKSFLAAKEEALLFHLIKTAFSQRRKMLLRLLFEDPQLGRTREEMQAVFNRLNIPLTARGEELLLKDYLALTQALHS